MNLKKAKKLRSVAREVTVGMPARAYVTTKQGQIKLQRDCTRWFYRQLKTMRADSIQRAVRQLEMGRSSGMSE